MKRLARDKHSNLALLFLIDKERSMKTLTTGVNALNLLSLPPKMGHLS
jgi:hypothetical protein